MKIAKLFAMVSLGHSHSDLQHVVVTTTTLKKPSTMAKS